MQQLHDVFISYSRKNAAFADCLERALASYKPPKGLKAPHRKLQVFRDKQDFTGNEYHRSLQTHLRDSAKLLVLCSPEAYQSEYVNDEIKQFAQLKGTDGIIPVLFSGIPNNEAGPGREAQKAFPSALCDVLEMPLAADFRGFTPKKGRINGSAFRDAWYTTLANIYDFRGFEWYYLWRLAEGPNAAIVVHEKVLDVAFSPDGKLFATLSEDGTVTLRSTDSRKELSRLAEGVSWIIGFSSDGKMLATDGKASVKLWDVSSGAITSEIKDLGDSDSVALSPSAPFLAAIRYENNQKMVRVWDITSQSVSAVAAGEGTASGSDIFLGFSPDGTMLAFSSGYGVEVCHFPSLEKIAEFDGTGRYVTAIAFSPNGNSLVAAGTDGTLLFYDPVAQHELARFDTHQAYINSVAFSPDGRFLYTADDGGTVRVWDAESHLARATWGGVGRVIAISPDSRIVATARVDKTIGLWGVYETLEYEELSRLPVATTEVDPGGDMPITSIIQSPRDNRLALASLDKVIIWDPAARKELARLSHQFSIPLPGSVAFSPDQKTIAIASGSVVLLWDIISKKVDELRAQTRSVYAVGFSPDGKCLVTGLVDGTVRFRRAAMDSEVRVTAN